MIKAFIFDIGEVLVNYDFKKIFFLLAQKLDMPTDVVQGYVQTHKEAMLLGDISLEKFFSDIEQLTPQARAISTERLWLEQAMPLVEVNTELVDMIEALRKNYTVGTLSNLTFSRKIIDQQLNLYSHFDFVFLSCDLHLKKPDPRFFEMAIEKAQADPAEIVYIDDNRKYTQVARGLGMHAFDYTYKNNSDLQAKLKELGIESIAPH
jgi:putative hydrolase of the HAD superfamily